MAELVIRLVFSLAVVVGLLLMMARFSAKRFQGRGDAFVRVMHRQALSRGSTVAVVTVGPRVLVLGTTEHQVRLLAELDPEELDMAVADPGELDLAVTDADVAGLEPNPLRPVAQIAPAVIGDEAASVEVEDSDSPMDRPSGRRTGGKHAAVTSARAAARRSDGALAGSVLSTDTWKQALAAATRKQRVAS
jgi:flagellar protein FliO/FliZ